MIAKKGILETLSILRSTTVDLYVIPYSCYVGEHLKSISATLASALPVCNINTTK